MYVPRPKVELQSAPRLSSRVARFSRRTESQAGRRESQASPKDRDVVSRNEIRPHVTDHYRANHHGGHGWKKPRSQGTTAAFVTHGVDAVTQAPVSALA